MPTTTARDVVTLALKAAGVTGVGQSPLSEDINDGFTLLNQMLNFWQKRRWLVPNLIDVYAPGNSEQFNSIGPGQYYNSLRPDKIQAAYFKQLNSGDNDVSYYLKPIWSYEDYARIGLKNLNSWPSYFFYDASFPYGRVYIWPIPTSDYEIHLLIKGPIGFKIELLVGEIDDAGTAYTDGTYLAVDLTSVDSFGNGATANITVAGGVVTTVTIADGGDGYKINDFLSVSSADIGGTGTGFVYKVTNVTATVDAEFNMPEDYEEPIHFNLTRRIIAHYQRPLNSEVNMLAAAGLKGIKQSNLQLSKLVMPGSLRFNNSNRFYIFNADAM
jgi:hypothetical protein